MQGDIVTNLYVVVSLFVFDPNFSLFLRIDQDWISCRIIHNYAIRYRQFIIGKSLNDKFSTIFRLIVAWSALSYKPLFITLTQLQ